MIYETDFSGLDMDTGMDYPRVGSPKSYNFNRSYFRKEMVTVNGVEYSAIRHVTGTGANFGMDFGTEVTGAGVYTIEVDAYKPTFTGVGGAFELYNNSNQEVGSPIINCWRSNRGYGVNCNTANAITDRYNGCSLWYEKFYFFGDSALQSISGICTGGVTIDRVNGKAKVYLKDRKAFIASFGDMDFHRLWWWSDSNMEWYMVGVRVVIGDLFELKG